MAEMLCIKHGSYDVGDLMSPSVLCPACEEIRLKNLCVVCEQHLATETVAESALDFIHGFTRRLCLCCFVKEIEEGLEKVQKNLTAQKAKLESAPCLAP